SSAGIDSNTLDVFDKCQGDNSTVEVSAKLAGPEDELEVTTDRVRSIVVRGQAPNPATCTLNVRVEPRGSSFGSVMISRVYARNYTNGVPSQYKAYQYDDFQQYCVYLSGRSCGDATNMD